MSAKKNPDTFGATFAERKSARTGEDIAVPDPKKYPAQSTFAERANGVGIAPVSGGDDSKAVTEEKAENKAVTSGESKGRARRKG